MTNPIAPIAAITPFVPFVAAPTGAAGSGGGLDVTGSSSTSGAGSFNAALDAALRAGAAVPGTDASTAVSSTAVTPSAEAGTLDFGGALARGFDAVADAQRTADSLAVAAATGQLVDPAQLTIATTKAQLMTQVATAIQSKAVTSFNTIMSMQA